MLTDKQRFPDFFDRIVIVVGIVVAGIAVGAATGRIAELCFQWLNL